MTLVWTEPKVALELKERLVSLALTDSTVLMETRVTLDPKENLVLTAFPVSLVTRASRVKKAPLDLKDRKVCSTVV